MEKNEIIKLLDAGYSKAEIDAMESTNESNDATDVSQSNAENDVQGKQNEEQDASIDSSQNVNVEQFTDTFNEMLKSMKKEMESFKKDIQSLNVKNADMGDIDNKESVDDILGKLVFPKKLK